MAIYPARLLCWVQQVIKGLKDAGGCAGCVQTLYIADLSIQFLEHQGDPGNYTVQTLVTALLFTKVLISVTSAWPNEESVPGVCVSE